MNILICAGHTTKGDGTGAVGYISESTENRVLSKLVVKYLKELGANADYYEINESKNYLSLQVAAANKKNYDLVVQIHFNAYKKVTQSMGTETLYRSSTGKKYAEQINKKLSALFKSRGVKHDINDVGKKLYWLSNTKSPAVLIETCFVDSKVDSDMYVMNKERVGQLIAEGIMNKDLNPPKPVDPIPTPKTDEYYRVVAGSFRNRDYAEDTKNKLIKSGFDAFIEVYKK